ncbi:MAG: EscU/YscU/HrcU family type III secretion system export apparatus switch protein [Chloroflexota bacterium]|nr:EscU/YscU/HrcU family type III secretion system export apparatus switch protein [Chloroflexota bacterium]
MSGERTEAATPRRREQLRGEGKAARSPELGGSIGLLAGCLVLQTSASAASTRLQGVLTGSLGEMAAIGRTANPDWLWAQHALGNAGQAWLLTTLPLMLVLPVLAIGVGFAQSTAISFKALLHFESLNPANGLKRVFSMQSLVGLVRSLAKVGIVGFVTWRGLQQSIHELPMIDGSTDPRAMSAFLGQSILNVGLPAAEVLLVMAIVDYAYARWSFSRMSRMTVQEVKEEHKQQEGDPLIRGHMRARQRKMASTRRQLQAVPTATVVVTNPTHIAVALKYERSMSSPRIVAMGGDVIADKIKRVAREAGVPLVENVALARGLFKSAQVGDEIPIALYQAVAEVLAYVYSLRRRGRRGSAAAAGAS